MQYLGNKMADTWTSLRFPENNASDYQGTVTFESMFDPNIGTLGQEALDLLSDAAVVTNADGSATTASAEDRAALNGSAPELQTVVAPSKPLVSQGKCTLYLPTNLVFSDGVEYGSVDLGVSGGLVEQGIRGGNSALDVFKRLGNEAVDQLGSLSDAFTRGLTSEAAQIAAVKLAGKINDGVRGGVELATGVTVNPNKRSILRGVAIRNFAFQFKMIPTSQQEANSIKQIIRFFRQEMYPEDIQFGGISYGYKFPNKWNITLSYKGQQVATRILPSFLTGLDTNYNPNSMSFHTDGSFPEIDLSLRFVEERALRKQDIQVNY